MFQNAVANEIFKQAQVNTNKNVKDFSDNEIEKMVNAIKGLYFKVFGCYENNQVYSGGVKLEDLTENLESKKIKNHNKTYGRDHLSVFCFRPDTGYSYL